MHLLRLTAPGVQTLERQAAVAYARSTNDRLAAIVRRRPTRFAALANVAPQDPVAAAAEVDISTTPGSSRCWSRWRATTRRSTSTRVRPRRR